MVKHPEKDIFLYGNVKNPHFCRLADLAKALLEKPSMTSVGKAEMGSSVEQMENVAPDILG